MPYRRSASFVSLLLAAWTTGCASLPPPGEKIVARSSLGPVHAAELDRFIAGREESDAAPASASRSRRERLEQMLALRALEAGAAAWLATPEGRALLARRHDDVLVAEMRARLERQATSAAAIDEAAVEAAYAARVGELEVPERLSVRHIFKRLPTSATAEERRAIENGVEALLAELRAGADFRTIARQRSESQTAAFDGLIAPLRRGDLDPALADLLWRLEPGELSGIVPTPVGFHIFKVEARLPASSIPPEALRRSVRATLERRAHDAALKSRYDQLLQASGADFRPELLDDPATGEEQVVLTLDGAGIRLGELLARWRALSFAERRATSLRSLLEDELGRRLLLREARRLGLAEAPEVAPRLAQARLRLLLERAEEGEAAKLTAELKAEAGEETLRAFHAQESVRYHLPERRRLSSIVLPIVASRSPHAVYDELDLLARRIRAGQESFADAARRRSQDPSARDGGDLGWVTARELSLWAGPRIGPAVFGLPVGEVSAPLLVEVYDESRFRDEPVAYLVVRVEQVLPEETPTYEEVAGEVERRYLATHAGEVRRRLRAALLTSIGATIDDAALAASAAQ